MRAFLPELRPAWWVARGYLWVLALSMVTDGTVHTLPLPEVLGTVIVGVPLAAAPIVSSVRLGRRTDPPRWVPFLDVATAVATLFLVVAVQDRATPTYVYYGPSAAPAGTLLGADGDPITNIFPYDAEGRLLDGVLLYDQRGAPVEVGEPGVDEDTGMALEVDPRVDANGAEIAHAYPRRVERPVLDRFGSVRGGEPVPPPAVVVPRPAASTTTTTAPPTTTTTTTAPPAAPADEPPADGGPPATP